MKILYIGCVKTSEVFLRKLIELNAEIIGIVTKEKSTFNADFVDLGSVACRENIPYCYTQDINNAETIQFIRDKKPDIIFCFGWSQLLNQKILIIPKYGVIGFHPAKLPDNRGRHPIIWALALGLQETASTFFIMDEKADTGNIIAQDLIEITYTDDAASLYDKVLKTGCKQIERLMREYHCGSIKSIRQRTQAGNVWRKRSKEDGKIDWRMSSNMIYNLVRALTHPYVGAHFIFQEKEYKVWKVKEVMTEDYRNIEPGKILAVYSNSNFLIKAGDNLIEVLECETIDFENNNYLKE